MSNGEIIKDDFKVLKYSEEELMKMPMGQLKALIAAGYKGDDYKKIMQMYRRRTQYGRM